MISAKALSSAIRMKRKALKDDGVENMVDTHSRPQMDANDVMLNKQTAQWRDTMDIPEPMEGPSDPADEDIDGTSQDKGTLAKKMARVAKILGSMMLG